MNTHNWRCFADKVIHFIQMQTFLTLIFFPIVIAWGLPLSLLAPVANMLFGSLLTLFLFLSSILFFCELLYIPNGWLVWALEQVSDMWLWILGWDLKWATIGFVRPPACMLWAIVLAAFIIMQLRYKNWPVATACLLSLLLFGSGVVLKLMSAQGPQLVSIARSDLSADSVTCLWHQSETIVIDPGLIGKTISAPTWVAYTLMPEIIKNTGSVKVDHLIALQLNGMLFESLAALCAKMTIKKIYIPYWTGKIPRGAWHKFCMLREAVKKSGGEIVRIQGDTALIVNDFLALEPLGRHLSYQGATYPAFCARGNVEERELVVLPMKAKAVNLSSLKSFRD